jgi:hypothetical protein
MNTYPGILARRDMLLRLIQHLPTSGSHETDGLLGGLSELVELYEAYAAAPASDEKTAMARVILLREQNLKALEEPLTPAVRRSWDGLKDAEVSLVQKRWRLAALLKRGHQ